MNHINVNHLVQFCDVLTEALEGGVLPLTLNGAFSKRILPLSVGQSSLSSLSAMNPFPKGNCTSTSLNSLPCSSTLGCLSASFSLGVLIPGDGFSSFSLITLTPLDRCHTNPALAGIQYKNCTCLCRLAHTYRTIDLFCCHRSHSGERQCRH